LAPLTPKTFYERRAAIWLSIAIGLSEEIIFRGLFIAAGVGLLHLSFLASAAVAVGVFGFGHLYQGVTGVLSSVYAGIVLTACYALGGNLLVPIVLHALWDVLGLVIVPAIHAKHPGSPSRLIDNELPESPLS
jgi:membrane protease YdiL (CAAX protease family)